MNSARQVLLITMLAGLMLAAWMPTGIASGEVYQFADQSATTGIELRSQDLGGVEVRYTMGSFGMEALSVDGETMQVITLPGVMLPNNAGAPNLPGLGSFIALPQGATASVEIIAARTQVFPNVAVAPAAPLPKETDDTPPVYRMNPEIYERNAHYPESPVLVSDLRKMRGVDMVALGITPFQYNPVTRELIVYTDLEVRVHFHGGNGQFGESRLRSRYWDPLLRDHILNHDALPEIDFDTPRGERTGYEYVIICPDDPAFVVWADTLKTWRKLQGISTEVFTTTDVGGTTSAAIESFLNNAYATWDPAPVAFLLLGDYPNSGDKGRDSGITSPIWGGSCVSDNIYADVDGDDLPDMAHARITARDAAELETMIQKMLSYERNPYTDAGFYDHPIIAGGWQDDRWFILCCETIFGHQELILGKSPVREYAIYSGTPGTFWSTNPNTSMIVDYFGPDGLGYIPATSAHLTDWGGNAARLNNDMNSGAYMLLHRDHGGVTGWGEPDYDINDLDNLTNDMYPFVFSINCLTGMYNSSSECFVERFHRITHGALGLIAASETSMSFVNDTFIWGLFDSLWPDFDPGYGDRNTGANNLRTSFGMASAKYYLDVSNWPYNPHDKVLTYHLFHHHGDAFITMYSEMPQDLTVIHDDVLFTDIDFFTVQADEGSIIALTVDGEIIGVTDATGLPQDIAITPQIEPGDLRVTITKANYFRYDVIVPIIPPDGPYMVVAAQTIDDDLLDDSAGNEDGGADAGETIELILTLRNAGCDPALNVQGTIRCSDPYLTVIDSVEVFGDVDPSEQVQCLEDYDFVVGPDCPDGHIFLFEVTIECDDRLLWDKYFTIQVEAPVMEFVDYTIDDTVGGDGDGRADPGETIFLLPRLGNTGSEDATSLTASLSIEHASVVILQGEATLALLPAGQETDFETAFEIQIDGDCPDPDILAASIVIDADWQQQGEGEFGIPVGGFFDDMEAGEGSWATEIVTAGFINQWHRSTQRNYTPGGSWSWKFGDTGPGDYASLADGALISAPLNLRQTCYLRFRHWMAAETSSAYPDHCYDGGMIEVSIDSGEWTQVTPVGGYPYLIRAGGTPGPWPAETPVFSGNINWAESVFELIDYSGMTVQFRFRFGSDGADVREGWYIDDVEFVGAGIDPSSADEVTPVQLYPVIAQNQPNPFHPQTAIRFELPGESDVQLRVFDPTGRLVRTLVDGHRESGVHLATWDGRNENGIAVGSGIYFYRFEAGDVTETRKMVLAR